MNDDAILQEDGVTNFACNVGAGLELAITNFISFNLEYKYKIVEDFDRSYFTFGLTYKF